MSPLFVFFGGTSVMSAMSVVVNASLLRDTEHTLDAARNAADDPADCAAHGSSVNEHAVLVDPRTHRIVEIID